MSRIARTAASVVLLAVLAACGRGATAPVPAPAGTNESPAPAGTDVGPAPSGCAAHPVADEDADGTTVCVVVGSDLIVELPAAGGGSWSVPRVTGGGVLGAGRGVPTPQGRVGWSFRALAAGTAGISLTRPVCPPAAPGAVTCHSVRVYALTVRVP